MKKETLEFALEMNRIFNVAVDKAQQRHRELGIPNVYCINGIIHYELPNGELTTKKPKNEDKKSQNQNE